MTDRLIGNLLYSDNCRLCNLIKDKSKIIGYIPDLYVVQCDICGNPMVVAIDHRLSLTNDEIEAIDRMLARNYGVHNYEFAYVADTDNFESFQHFHWHILPRHSHEEQDRPDSRQPD